MATETQAPAVLERVSVVIPTWNERENIALLIDALRRAHDGGHVEWVVVDDGSPDGTAEVVREIGQGDGRVRLVQRPGKQGLSSAVLEGVCSSTGGIVVMMDADFSHDPSLVPALVQKVREGNDVVVGSRYAKGGHIPGWPWHRRLASKTFTLAARGLFRLRVRDPLSGFVAFRRGVLEGLPTRYSARGFKLLLEVLATGRRLRVAEVPITFVDRTRGVSKAGLREVVEFLRLCGRLAAWRWTHRGQQSKPSAE